MSSDWAEVSLLPGHDRREVVPNDSRERKQHEFCQFFRSQEEAEEGQRYDTEPESHPGHAVLWQQRFEHVSQQASPDHIPDQGLTAAAECVLHAHYQQKVEESEN